ncbi:skin secretory protein xP2-like [Onychostoma macrolepis]|uniref:skin secretory protein xP2-like n=1 Tax=Onychostoma macrolepis TaxID=369639 RepID=UPI00272B397F|nr:skin secretory protein xP2-like [Onychostoma macrolepis]
MAESSASAVIQRSFRAALYPWSAPQPVGLPLERAGTSAERGIPPVSFGAPPDDQMSVAALESESPSGDDDSAALPPSGVPLSLLAAVAPLRLPRLPQPQQPSTRQRRGAGRRQDAQPVQAPAKPGGKRKQQWVAQEHPSCPFVEPGKGGSTQVPASSRHTPGCHKPQARFLCFLPHEEESGECYTAHPDPAPAITGQAVTGSGRVPVFHLAAPPSAVPSLEGAQILEPSPGEAPIPQSIPGEALDPESSPGVAPMPQLNPGEALDPESSPGGAPVPKPSPGEAPVPKQSPGEAPVPQPSPGVAPMPQLSPGEASDPESSPGGAPVPQPSPGGASVPQPSPGVAPMRQSSPGGAPVPKPSPGVAPMPQSNPGEAPVPQPNPGGAPVPRPSPGGASVPQPSQGEAPVPERPPEGDFPKKILRGAIWTVSVWPGQGPRPRSQQIRHGLPSRQIRHGSRNGRHPGGRPSPNSGP